MLEPVSYRGGLFLPNFKNQMSIKVQKTVTGSEPITLDEAKAWMRISTDADDTLITALITQARELIENYLNRSIVPTTLVVDATPRYELQLPYGPVDTITSVKDENDDDVEYTWNGFTLTFGQRVFDVTAGWTQVYTTTTYDAGDDPIPAGLKLGLLETIAYLYEHRGEDNSIQLFLYQNQNLQPYRETVWI